MPPLLGCGTTLSSIFGGASAGERTFSAETVDADLMNHGRDTVPFKAQVSSPESLASTGTGGQSDTSKLLSRQISEIDDLAFDILEAGPLQEALCAAVSGCKFSVTVADPRCPDTPLVAVSDAFEAITGYAKAEIIGMNCRFLNNDGSELDPADIAALRAACTTGEAFVGILNNRRKSGEMFLNLLDLRGLTVAEDPETGEELWYLIGIQADVTGMALANLSPDGHLQELHELAERLRDEILLRPGVSEEIVKEAEASGAVVGPPREPRRWRALPEPRLRPSAPLAALKKAEGVDATALREMLEQMEPVTEEQKNSSGCRFAASTGTILAAATVAAAALAGFLLGRRTLSGS
mmetsp:Transcript_95704/g.194510  ORF Transcript_95704/g.194510 Transcript_95704/m.194510 type:complete len:352 (-) Transcript_95704:136-1191(-)